MPTVAALNLGVTTDAPQDFICRGARNFQITISRAGVYLAYAPSQNGIIGGYGIEEFQGPITLVISDEPIGAIRYRSAVTNTPATINIVATT